MLHQLTRALKIVCVPRMMSIRLPCSSPSFGPIATSPLLTPRVPLFAVHSTHFFDLTLCAGTRSDPFQATVPYLEKVNNEASPHAGENIVRALRKSFFRTSSPFRHTLACPLHFIPGHLTSAPQPS
jgi:hypothetical protein